MRPHRETPGWLSASPSLNNSAGGVGQAAIVSSNITPFPFAPARTFDLAALPVPLCSSALDARLSLPKAPATASCHLVDMNLSHLSCFAICLRMELTKQSRKGLTAHTHPLKGGLKETKICPNKTRGLHCEMRAQVPASSQPTVRP